MRRWKKVNDCTYTYKKICQKSFYLNAFNPCLDPQLFHQFPGLGDIISGRHADPSECTNTGEN